MRGRTDLSMMSIANDLANSDSWTRASVSKAAAPAVRPPNLQLTHRGRRSLQSRSRRWSSWQSRFPHDVVSVVCIVNAEANPEESCLVSAAVAGASASVPARAPCVPARARAPAPTPAAAAAAAAAAPCAPAPAASLFVPAPAAAAPAGASAAAVAAAAAAAAAAVANVSALPRVGDDNVNVSSALGKFEVPVD